MSHHTIRKGLDIPIQGAANGAIVDLEPPDSVAYSPTEIRGLVAKPAKRQGDAVAAGTVLFFHKFDPKIVFRSPVAGVLAEIRRGRRRVITDVVVEAKGDQAETFERYTLEEIADLDAAAALDAAKATGLWPTLRTRPLDKMPSGDGCPQSILIGAMETGPLQPGVEALLTAEDREGLQAAVTLFRRIAPKVFLARRAGAAHPALDGLKGVEEHTFSGPHPAGDPSVQVNLVDPPRGAQAVWTIRAWDAALLGRALLTGTFPTDRVYAAVGAGVQTPRLVRTRLGAPLAHIVGPVHGGDMRWIRGSVLTGQAIDAARWASMCSRAVHVLPSTVPRSLLGWALPMFGTWSFHRAFLSGLIGSRPEGASI